MAALTNVPYNTSFNFGSATACHTTGPSHFSGFFLFPKRKFVPLTIDYWKSSSKSIEGSLHKLSQHLCKLNPKSSTISIILDDLYLQLPCTVLNQVWPWALTAAEYNKGSVFLAETPLNTLPALFAFTEHIFGNKSTLFCDHGYQNMLAGMSIANFFDVPSLTEITAATLFHIVDEENVCEILSNLTLSKSRLRAKCMRVYISNPNLLELHAHSGKLSPSLYMEIHALTKALSCTPSSDWKFSKDSDISSYDEMIAVMESSIDEQVQTLKENKRRVQNNFVDGSGRQIQWDSNQMKKTRELYEEQEANLLAKQVYVQKHRELSNKIEYNSVLERDDDDDDDDDDDNAVTVNKTLRQISNEGRQILREALDAKFTAKAKIKNKM